MVYRLIRHDSLAKMQHSIPRFPLVAEQTLLVGLNCPHVGLRILAIVEPVLNQLQVVANASTVQPHPMDAFDPVAFESILL